MDSQAAVSAYRQASCENAPPLKLIHMLYEGALKLLAQAKEMNPTEQHLEFSRSLLRARDIVTELRLSLNREVSPELCANLSSLYLFVEGQIQDALLERKVDPLDGAIQVIERLDDGWKHIQVPEAGVTP